MSETARNVIGGRYQILAPLGKGGMGIVFKAYDPVLDRTVALKKMVASVIDSDERRKRFYIEARAAARLNHPNIVTIHELEEHAGDIYIVMELLEGVSLAAFLQHRVPMSLAGYLTILAQVASGLHYAHSRAIVHRDIKPPNLVMTTHGVVKILDFGIAQLASGEITTKGALLGTPHYMAPEQARGERIDARADLFALGAVGYELVTGVKPFTADSIAALLIKITDTPHTPVREAVPDASPALADLIDRLLSKDRVHRPTSGAELHASLERIGEIDREDLVAEAVRSLLGPSSEDTVFQPISTDPSPIPGEASASAQNDADRIDWTDDVIQVPLPGAVAALSGIGTPAPIEPPSPIESAPPMAGSPLSAASSGSPIESAVADDLTLGGGVVGAGFISGGLTPRPLPADDPGRTLANEELSPAASEGATIIVPPPIPPPIPSSGTSSGSPAGSSASVPPVPPPIVARGSDTEPDVAPPAISQPSAPAVASPVSVDPQIAASAQVEARPSEPPRSAPPDPQPVAPRAAGAGASVAGSSTHAQPVVSAPQPVVSTGVPVARTRRGSGLALLAIAAVLVLAFGATGWWWYTSLRSSTTKTSQQSPSTSPSTTSQTPATPGGPATTTDASNSASPSSSSSTPESSAQPPQSGESTSPTDPPSSGTTPVGPGTDANSATSTAATTTSPTTPGDRPSTTDATTQPATSTDGDRTANARDTTGPNAATRESGRDATRTTPPSNPPPTDDSPGKPTDSSRDTTAPARDQGNRDAPARDQGSRDTQTRTPFDSSSVSAFQSRGSQSGTFYTDSPSTAAAVARITYTLEAYSNAIEKRDLDALRDVRNPVTPAESALVSGTPATTVRFTDLDINVDGTQGRVRCRRAITTGGKRSTSQVEVHLTRRPSGWVITDIR
jgi:eukaryotic-like serine/threonine-protein kinase